MPAFVFTDIEGSTRTLASLGNDAYEALLERHRDAIVRNARERGGSLVRAEGDGCFLVFDNASDALSACVAAQLELQQLEVPVRMGVHSGDAAPTPDGDWVGLAVHHAARVGDAANGGQIILSEAAADEARPLPEFVALDDLGAFHLRDVDGELHLFKAVHPDLASDDREPRAASGAVHNLPLIRTSFIGRIDEMKEVTKLLLSHPLVTITGTGGIGKTRLAIEAASVVTNAYADGAWLVELASIDDPALVGTRVADALDLPDDPGRANFDRIASELREKRTLLIFDNCEHVIDQAAELVDTILRTCKDVAILATSREPLRIRGEAVWRAPSLAVPAGDDLEAIAVAEAVRLFCDRAELVAGRFTLDDANAPVIAHITRRLDGIPLAIELAAARVGSLDVDAIAASLDDRFNTLASGYRTDLPRQQTLRATIDWSHDLLDDDERRIFRRLSVFRGGAKMHAITWTCNDKEDADKIVSSLIDRSLVLPADDRYTMLETILAYAAEKLDEAGETHELRERHREYFLKYAKWRDAPEGEEEPDGQVIERLYAEIENYRAALDVATDEITLDLVGHLSLVWFRHGLLEEGHRWLKAALDAHLEPSDLRAGALGGFANIAISLGRYEEGIAAQDEALVWYRGHADGKILLESVYGRAETALALGRIGEARPLLAEALDLAKAYGDEGIIAQVHYALAFVAAEDADYESALEYAKLAYEGFASENLQFFEASARSMYGHLACNVGRFDEGREALLAAVALSTEVRDRVSAGWARWYLGQLEWSVGNHAAAVAALEEALADAEATGDVVQELIRVDLAFARFQADPSDATLEEIDAARREAKTHPSGPAQGFARRAAALLEIGRPGEALTDARESFALVREMGGRPQMMETITLAALASSGIGDHEAAVRGLACVDAERSRSGGFIQPGDAQRIETAMEQARAALGAEGYDRAWSEGAALPLDEAL